MKIAPNFTCFRLQIIYGGWPQILRLALESTPGFQSRDIQSFASISRGSSEISWQN